MQLKSIFFKCIWKIPYIENVFEMYEAKISISYCFFAFCLLAKYHLSKAPGINANWQLDANSSFYYIYYIT